MASFPRSFSLAVLLSFLLTGCALVKLDKDVNKGLQSTVLIGRVHSDFQGNGHIVVAACSTGKERKVVHYTVLHDSGEYELMVGQGQYYVFAFLDINSNLVYEAGERAGQFGDPDPVTVPPVGVVFDIDVTIQEKGSDIVIPHGYKITDVLPEKLHSRQAGAIVDLDDERFADENGAKGFWEPYAFFRQFGGNIYFLEEYSPEKIPILFIHGAGGTPKGWHYFVENIDRSRYQPWFFYYPSGARIDSMSYLLFWKLSNLQSRYQFTTMYITAHSMGGLVARSFIVNHGLHFPFVKLFISLATPWGGDKMAEYGVQQSPAVIPSWIDMQPEGDFIKSLYRKKMPEHTSFYMFYGHRGSRNPFRSNNDGTITMASLLDYRPQSEAEMNFAFNEDHASIVFSQEVLAQYNTILDEFDEKNSAVKQRSGGYLQINLTYSYEFDGVRPIPTLILHPSDNVAEEIVTFLSDDSGRVLGPFPPGDYLASVVTMGGKTRKKYIPVSITSKETRELDVVFVADGVIRGCVTAPLEAEDTSVGMPDYRYRSVDREINIRSVSLSSSEIQRDVEPVKGEDVDNYNYLIIRDDFCYNTCFGFFGLPAGDYTLSITAEGYKPLVKQYSVTPGTPEYYRVSEFEMTAD